MPFSAQKTELCFVLKALMRKSGASDKKRILSTTTSLREGVAYQLHRYNRIQRYFQSLHIRQECLLDLITS